MFLIRFLIASQMPVTKILYYNETDYMKISHEVIMDEKEYSESLKRNIH